jgi:eukaryotic-like serine/threonine-protein kinase
VPPQHPDADLINGRFALGPVIGQGAMAEVREAEDRVLTRRAAVKLLLPSLAEQREPRLRFEEEARVAARVNDPNVVAIYDTGEHLGRPFIVMELLPGTTLRDEMRKGPLSEARAVDVITHVLRALHAAHTAGVIHRDIKPGNVLLTADGRAKVADFGIAKVATSSDLTANGLILGTPSYLAPECVTGDPATVASDIYAVGVVLYEAIGGRVPFSGDTPLAVCHAISSEEPTPLRELRPDVSAPLAAVVHRAMAKDPARRYPSADDMLHAIESAVPPSALVIDEPTRAVDDMQTDPTLTSPVVAPLAYGAAFRPTPFAPERPRFGRRRALAFGLAALIMLLAGGALFATLRSHGADATRNTTPEATVKPTVSNPSSPSSSLAPTTVQVTAAVTLAPVTTVPVATSTAGSTPTTTKSTTPRTSPATTAPPPTTSPAPTTLPPTTLSPTTTVPAT